MVGRIQIVNRIPIHYSINGAVMIPSFYRNDEMKEEYQEDDFYMRRSLTWRDFTHNMDVFDYNFDAISRVTIMEYGEMVNGIRRPDDNYRFIFSKLNPSVPLAVGDSFPCFYDPNNYNIDEPIRTREMNSDRNLCEAFIRNNRISTTGLCYCIVLVEYNNTPRTNYKIVYTYGFEKIQGMDLKYVIPKNTRIEVRENRVQTINFFDIMIKNKMHYKNSYGVILLEDIEPFFVQMFSRIFSGIWDDIKKYAMFLKMTIYDPNGDDEFTNRFYLDGRRLPQRMDISYEMFIEGRVAFDSSGMKEGDEYLVDINLWDMIFGTIRMDYA